MSVQRRVLITGAGGQVGKALFRSVPVNVHAIALTHAELDIGDADRVYEAIEALSPDAIINAAAYTAVDRAESEPEEAFRINRDGPRNLANAAERAGSVRLVHISTDFVFDGSSSAPYKPEDQTRPLSTYGRSKEAGEREILQNLASACVVRTAWVHSVEGTNFVKTMLRLMTERGRVNVVSDQVGSPTFAVSLARVLWRFALRPELSGVFHWTDAGLASWYDFAVAIAEEGQHFGVIPTRPSVRPIASEDYPTAAVRPRYSVLDTRFTTAKLEIAPNHWREELRVVIEELAVA